MNRVVVWMERACGVFVSRDSANAIAPLSPIAPSNKNVILTSFTSYLTLNK